MTSVTLDPQRQQQAKVYARIRRRLFLVDIIVGGVYALAWLLFGWSASLKTTLLTLTTGYWLLCSARTF